MRLPLNELFDTVQGEGSKTGTPSVFVRLQGCGVGCPWCDTKHTWDMKQASPLLAVMDKHLGDHRFAWLSATDLADLVARRGTRHVVITGGEPCQYDLNDFTETLLDMGRSVQIETSGTEEVRAADEVFVTVSPKVAMPGGKHIVAQAVERADEIKMPVGKADDIDKLLKVLDLRRRPILNNNIWLQPISESVKATELCRQVAADKGWRVSLQMHKQANIR